MSGACHVCDGENGGCPHCLYSDGGCPHCHPTIAAAIILRNRTGWKMSECEKCIATMTPEAIEILVTMRSIITYDDWKDPAFEILDRIDSERKSDAPELAEAIAKYGNENKSKMNKLVAGTTVVSKPGAAVTCTEVKLTDEGLKALGFESKKDQEWAHTFNKYQRDNLLWLLTLVREGDLPNCNTGDWVGELSFALAKPGKNWDLDETDHPNVSLEEWRKWQQEKK